MIAHIATLGPESQSHLRQPEQVRVAGERRRRRSGFTRPTPPRMMWSRPRESENHCGPWMPKKPSSALTAPPLVNMNRNTTLIATELVTDGK